MAHNPNQEADERLEIDDDERHQMEAEDGAQELMAQLHPEEFNDLIVDPVLGDEAPGEADEFEADTSEGENEQLVPAGAHNDDGDDEDGDNGELGLMAQAATDADKMDFDALCREGRGEEGGAAAAAANADQGAPKKKWVQNRVPADIFSNPRYTDKNLRAVFPIDPATTEGAFRKVVDAIPIRSLTDYTPKVDTTDDAFRDALMQWVEETFVAGDDGVEKALERSAGAITAMGTAIVESEALYGRLATAVGAAESRADAAEIADTLRALVFRFSGIAIEDIAALFGPSMDVEPLGEAVARHIDPLVNTHNKLVILREELWGEGVATPSWAVNVRDIAMQLAREHVRFTSSWEAFKHLCTRYPEALLTAPAKVFELFAGIATLSAQRDANGPLLVHQAKTLLRSIAIMDAAAFIAVDMGGILTANFRARIASRSLITSQALLVTAPPGNGKSQAMFNTVTSLHAACFGRYKLVVLFLSPQNNLNIQNARFFRREAQKHERAPFRAFTSAEVALISERGTAEQRGELDAALRSPEPVIFFSTVHSLARIQGVVEKGSEGRAVGNYTAVVWDEVTHTVESLSDSSLVNQAIVTKLTHAIATDHVLNVRTFVALCATNGAFTTQCGSMFSVFFDVVRSARRTKRWHFTHATAIRATPFSSHRRGAKLVVIPVGQKLADKMRKTRMILALLHLLVFQPRGALENTAIERKLMYIGTNIHARTLSGCIASEEMTQRNATGDDGERLYKDLHAIVYSVVSPTNNKTVTIPPEIAVQCHQSMANLISPPTVIEENEQNYAHAIIGSPSISVGVHTTTRRVRRERIDEAVQFLDAFADEMEENRCDEDDCTSTRRFAAQLLAHKARLEAEEAGEPAPPMPEGGDLDPDWNPDHCGLGVTVIDASRFGISDAHKIQSLARQRNGGIIFVFVQKDVPCADDPAPSVNGITPNMSLAAALGDRQDADLAENQRNLWRTRLAPNYIEGAESLLIGVRKDIDKTDIAEEHEASGQIPKTNMFTRPGPWNTYLEEARKSTKAEYATTDSFINAVLVSTACTFRPVHSDADFLKMLFVACGGPGVTKEDVLNAWERAKLLTDGLAQDPEIVTRVKLQYPPDIEPHFVSTQKAVATLVQKAYRALHKSLRTPENRELLAEFYRGERLFSLSDISQRISKRMTNLRLLNSSILDTRAKSPLRNALLAVRLHFLEVCECAMSGVPLGGKLFENAFANIVSVPVNLILAHCLVGFSETHRVLKNIRLTILDIIDNNLDAEFPIVVDRALGDATPRTGCVRWLATVVTSYLMAIDRANDPEHVERPSARRVLAALVKIVMRYSPLPFDLETDKSEQKKNAPPYRAVFTGTPIGTMTPLEAFKWAQDDRYNALCADKKITTMEDISQEVIDFDEYGSASLVGQMRQYLCEKGVNAQFDIRDFVEGAEGADGEAPAPMVDEAEAEDADARNALVVSNEAKVLAALREDGRCEAALEAATAFALPRLRNAEAGAEVDADAILAGAREVADALHAEPHLCSGPLLPGVVAAHTRNVTHGRIESFANIFALEGSMHEDRRVTEAEVAADADPDHAHDVMGVQTMLMITRIANSVHEKFETFNGLIGAGDPVAPAIPPLPVQEVTSDESDGGGNGADDGVPHRDEDAMDLDGDADDDDDGGILELDNCNSRLSWSITNPPQPRAPSNEGAGAGGERAIHTDRSKQKHRMRPSGGRPALRTFALVQQEEASFSCLPTMPTAVSQLQTASARLIRKQKKGAKGGRASGGEDGDDEDDEGGNGNGGKRVDDYPDLPFFGDAPEDAKSTMTRASKRSRADKTIGSLPLRRAASDPEAGAGAGASVSSPMARPSAARRAQCSPASVRASANGTDSDCHRTPSSSPNERPLNTQSLPIPKPPASVCSSVGSKSSRTEAARAKRWRPPTQKRFAQTGEGAAARGSPVVVTPASPAEIVTGAGADGPVFAGMDAGGVSRSPTAFERIAFMAEASATGRSLHASNEEIRRGALAAMARNAEEALLSESEASSMVMEAYGRKRKGSTPAPPAAKRKRGRPKSVSKK